MLSNMDRVRLAMAATDEGFGLSRGEVDTWLRYGSIDAPAELRLNRDGDAYLAATNHSGVATSLSSEWPLWNGELPSGFTAFIASDTGQLHHLVRGIWRLARALPSEPYRAFEASTRGLPTTTEAERLVVERIGQNIFRRSLIDYWGGTCAVLGVSEPKLLRASHIRPWAECDTDEERLNVFNGLLLAAHLDAAFDGFLISFDDDGQILISSLMSASDRNALGLHEGLRLAKVASDHLPRLAWHRKRLISSALQNVNATVNETG